MPQSASELNGVWYREKNCESVLAICASNAARLCTKKECEENCSADTVCEFDLELIWSSATGSPTTAPSVEPSVRPTSVYSMNPCKHTRLFLQECIQSILLKHT